MPVLTLAFFLGCDHRPMVTIPGGAAGAGEYNFAAAVWGMDASKA